jgi:hypothetical protein
MQPGKRPLVTITFAERGAHDGGWASSFDRSEEYMETFR